MRSAGNGVETRGACMLSVCASAESKFSAKSSVHLAPLGHRLFGYPILVQAPSVAARFDHANPGAAAAVSMARSPRPRLHTRRCLGLALPADSSTAALGRHRPACAMRCDPATPRPNQLRGFPARLSLPPTMLAPTRLHPNPLVCPDRSNSHRSIDVSPHPRCHLPPNPLAPASRCLSTMLHTRCT